MCTEGKQRGDAEKQGARGREGAERRDRRLRGPWPASLRRHRELLRCPGGGGSPAERSEEPYIWNTPRASLCFADMGEVTDGSRSRDLKKEKNVKAKEGRNSSKEEGNKKQSEREGGGRTEEGGSDIREGWQRWLSPPSAGSGERGVG